MTIQASQIVYRFRYIDILNVKYMYGSNAQKV